MPSSRSRPKSPEPKGNTIRGNVIFPESACTAEGHYLYPPPVLKVVIPSGLFDPSMYKLEAWATLVCPVDEHRNLDYVLDGVVDCGPEDVRRAPAVTIPNEEGIFFPFVSLSMNQQCFYSVRISVHLVERLDGSCKATLGSYRTGVITVLDGKGAAPQVEFSKDIEDLLTKIRNTSILPNDEIPESRANYNENIDTNLCGVNTCF